MARSRRLAQARQRMLAAITELGPAQAVTFSVGLRRGSKCSRDGVPYEISVASLHKCAARMARRFLDAGGRSTVRVVGAYEDADEPSATVTVYNETDEGWRKPEAKFAAGAREMAQALADTFCQDAVYAVVSDGDKSKTISASLNPDAEPSCPLAPMSKGERGIHMYPIKGGARR